MLRYWAIWLSVGATVGLVVSLLHGAVWLQITVAILVSAGLLWFSRSWAKQVRCEDLMTEMIPENTENAEDSPAWADCVNSVSDSEKEDFTNVSADEDIAGESIVEERFSQLLSFASFPE